MLDDLEAARWQLELVWSRLNVGGTCDDGSRSPPSERLCLGLRLRDARCEIGSRE
jgi:hypothetical protein